MWPCWLCKIVKWSWTFPWIWFLLETAGLWPGDQVRTLGDMATRVGGFLQVGINVVIAAAISYALRKLWERLDERGVCDC